MPRTQQLPIHALVMITIVLECASARAQFNSFAEGYEPQGGSKGLSASIPDLRISGIGSLNQVTDSADNAASANVLAEFNLIDLKFGGGTVEKAIRFLEMSAAGKEDRALMTLGYVYETGMTGVQDINLSKDYLRAHR